jgi:hypothetical protein
MRLAYFIATHHNIEQFRWTFSAVYNQRDLFAIHVDRKSGQPFYDAVAEVVGDKANVHFIPRHLCSWSGWSCCAAELDGMRELLSLATDWRYLINLSGQCYPIKPIEQIRSTLSSTWPQNLIRACAFSEIAQNEPRDVHLKRPVVFEFKGKIRRLPLRWPKHRSVNWKGLTWHLLTRPFCEYVFNSGALKAIPTSLKYTFCPDELLFQTLIMQSPFRNTVAEDNYSLLPMTKIREVVWPGPKILTIEDLPRLKQSSAFFARKFDCHRDDRILRVLAAENGLAMPEDVDRRGRLHYAGISPRS